MEVLGWGSGGGLWWRMLVEVAVKAVEMDGGTGRGGGGDGGWL